jgi:signal transduction histidine kinase
VAAGRELQKTADGAARAISSACRDRDPQCAVELAQAISGESWRVSLDQRAPAVAPATAGAARLEDGRTLIVSPVAPQAAAVHPSVAGLQLGYLLLNALLTFVVGLLLLQRVVTRPLDRLADAADRIGRLELDDPLGGSTPTLGRLGTAFERMAHSLREERSRLADKIAELERVNRQLAEARDSLVRTEKLATVGRLAAGVAHEVGNPLGAIVGYLDLARSRAQGEELQDWLSRIEREVSRIDRTVRELLDFSRPAAVQQPAPCGLREAVEAAVSLAKVQKRLKHVEFDTDIAPALSVLAEPHRLSQVLVNVLLNAGDAMKGQGRVTLSARLLDAPHRGSDARVELSIGDTGPGIPSADLPRVFDPFFTTKAPGEGTGLGLSICHRIMETFGGEIRAANREEGGAEFTLLFRAAPSPPG